MPKGTGGIIEILHTPLLQDSIADSGMPGYILKILLDVNNPVGALVFVCVVGGIFAFLIAILDSLKPPNFPPGPRWLPFGGDRSAICEKPMIKTTVTTLLKQFGPVVGLRQNKGHRNPIVLALDAASAETVEHAARNGFLEYRSSECSKFKISELTGIPPSFKYQINVVLKSENTTKLIEKCAHEATNDLFEVLNDIPQQINSSLISEAILAALLNVISGRRVKPASPCLTELHKILIDNSELNCTLHDNPWTTNYDNASRAAQYYSKIIMTLSDFDEQATCISTESCLPSVFESLAKNHVLLTLQEKSLIIADILIRSNIGHCLAMTAEYLNDVDVRRLWIRPDTKFSLGLICKEACYKECTALFCDVSERLPPLKFGRRWEVLKSFYLNGFIVPQGSFVQTILLSRQKTFSITEEWTPYEMRVMDLIGRVLGEIIFSPEAQKMFTTGRENEMNYED